MQHTGVEPPHVRFCPQGTPASPAPLLLPLLLPLPLPLELPLLEPLLEPELLPLLLLAVPSVVPPSSPPLLTADVEPPHAAASAVPDEMTRRRTLR
jgi:hypothetical protein